MKPERLRELAERLAKAMPERFAYAGSSGLPEMWFLRRYRGYQRVWSDQTETSEWWSLIGPLLDELEISYVTRFLSPGGLAERYDTMLESAFVAVVEAAEAKR